ncbi:MAG: hypothetical protein V4487_05940 [Chlamydiota bacterium]
MTSVTQIKHPIDFSTPFQEEKKENKEKSSAIQQKLEAALEQPFKHVVSIAAHLSKIYPTWYNFLVSDGFACHHVERIDRSCKGCRKFQAKWNQSTDRIEGEITTCRYQLTRIAGAVKEVRDLKIIYSNELPLVLNSKNSDFFLSNGEELYHYKFNPKVDASAVLRYSDHSLPDWTQLTNNLRTIFKNPVSGCFLTHSGPQCDVIKIPIPDEALVQDLKDVPL